jgi:hypothetical protein
MNPSAPEFNPSYIPRQKKRWNKKYKNTSVLNPEESESLIYDYESFHYDPLNSDINYIIENFLDNPNRESLRYLNYIEDSQRTIFNYIYNYAPYRQRVYDNKKIIMLKKKKYFKFKKIENHLVY